jgi:hypothetical protein
VAEKALSETYETINVFAALIRDVFLQTKGLAYYLVIIAMFPCHYATIYADWTDPTQKTKQAFSRIHRPVNSLAAFRGPPDEDPSYPCLIPLRKGVAAKACCIQAASGSYKTEPQQSSVFIAASCAKTAIACTFDASV